MAAVILAGDVGGTKTRLGLFRIEDGVPVLIREHRYATADFSGLEVVCIDFIRLSREAIASACFGVPGPVIGGEARATNVPWTMREDALSHALNGTRVRLINDMGAAAYGIIHLVDSEVCVLQRGALPMHQGNVAIIGVGTGLGEAALMFENGRHYAVASEGGHASFAPRDDEQIELYRYLRARFGHVSVERVLSGPGLFNIYRFLCVRPGPTPQRLADRLLKEDAGAVISDAALNHRDPECIRALEMFIDIFGAEAGNLALKMLALGGVYISGGIAPKILPALTDGRFTRAFADKGRLYEMLSKIEVRVALNEATGLIGAAWCAASVL